MQPFPRLRWPSLGRTTQWSGLEKSWRFFPAAHRQRSAALLHICGIFAAFEDKLRE